MTEFLDLFLNFVLSFGIAGILLLAILDSTFFFFAPFALDALLIILISKNRDWMPLYATVAAAGSICGCALTYFLMRRASVEALEKRFSKKKFERVKQKIRKNGFWGLMISSLLPPPFPFTPFVVAAGVTQFPKNKAFSAISIGRTIRYFGEGMLSLVLGRQILQLLEWKPFKAAMFSLFLLAAVGSAVTIYRWLRLR